MMDVEDLDEEEYDDVKDAGGEEAMDVEGGQDLVSTEFSVGLLTFIKLYLLKIYFYYIG